jgi:hypothetical protein
VARCSLDWAGTVLRVTAPLVAILGAGASRGCGDFDETMPRLGMEVRIPPLTVDLFDEHKYGTVLRKYDLAHQAGRFIAEERAQDDALGLEAAPERDLGRGEEVRLPHRDRR